MTCICGGTGMISDAQGWRMCWLCHSGQRLRESPRVRRRTRT